ncbi:MAG: hypothetical protein NWQ46_02865 [Spirosomaceae bacterium]|nr:hypothetical protein [Spirosomataceae bacterium]MDP5139971.1 hypothetical protein [Spirosomataceae bacterium]
MKKALSLISLLSITLVFISGCGGGVAPVSERVAKVWSARIVKHGSTIVYSRGGTNNSSPGYATYSLNLASAPNVRLTEVEGTTFAGNYEVPSDTRLVLTNLSPQPTGSSGNLEFTIQSIAEDGSEMVILGTAYAKTGGTVNTYTLTSN